MVDIWAAFWEDGCSEDSSLSVPSNYTCIFNNPYHNTSTAHHHVNNITTLHITTQTTTQHNTTQPNPHQEIERAKVSISISIHPAHVPTHQPLYNLLSVHTIYTSHPSPTNPFPAKSQGRIE